MKKNCVVCGELFTTFDDRKQYCSGKCRQKAYRVGNQGKQSVARYNLRYKRPDVQRVCKVCNETFITSRTVRYICDRPDCRSKARYITTKQYRKNNNQKCKARDIISKAINREGSITRQPCAICNTDLTCY